MTQFNNAQDVREFTLAGNAIITLVSKKTGSRFTYRVQAPKLTLSGEPVEKDAAFLWFVQLLTGPDNMSSYSYLGTIRLGVSGPRYAHGKKSKINASSPGASAFNWFWSQLMHNGAIPSNLEVWHEGRCGRCARLLTVPDSVARGIGPDCASKMSSSWAIAA